MEKRKLRILSCGENSYLATGFGNYYRELLTELHNSDKYDLLELGYGHIGAYEDDRQYMIPWEYMSNSPNMKNQDEVNRFNINQINPNHFGGFRFEEACLKHKPDIVFSAVDPYCFNIYTDSPFRDFFHLALSPTVDGDPADPQWIDWFSKADSVFAYTDWGLKLLDKQGKGSIKTVCSIPPGADIDCFKPVVDKKAHKASFGINPDSFVIGTVMRNQFRKLFPDLMEAFAKMVHNDKKEDFLLYLHTTYPDAGWNIPQLIKEFNIGNKVLLTYKCHSCNHFFCSFFKDAKTICKKCGKLAATMTNPNFGVDRTELAYIINTFDLYVQYANREGYGMGQVEAASCGVPIMATDYSAMEDIVRKCYGYPIKVARFAKEVSMPSYYALPDNDDFIKKVYEFYNMPKMMQAKMGQKARKGVLENYTYQLTAQKLMNRFDTIEPKNLWDSPKRVVNSNPNIPPNLSDEEFVRWCIINIVGDTRLLGSYQMVKDIRDLSWESKTKENVAKEYIGVSNKFRFWEEQRTKK